MPLLHNGPSDELIPVAAVDDLLRTVRVGLDRLEVELQQAKLEVLQLDAELATSVDVEAHEARLELARSSIESAALGAQEHLDRVVAAANAHAAARVAGAEAEAQWLVQRAREDKARELVSPLGVGDPLPPAEIVPSVDALPPTEVLTSWALHTAPPVQPSRVAAPLAAPVVARVGAPAPAAAPPPPAPSAAPGPLAPPEPEVEGSADHVFWAEATERDRARGSGVDPLLTAISALLVLAILAILLAWIG